MTTAPVTLGAEYFDGMYRAARDPWGFESRWYEQRKYDISIALLPERRYRSGFEPGCSVGVLTAMLAQRCDRLLSWDLSAAAVGSAADRTRSMTNVRVEQSAIPGCWPSGAFDLIVLSEVLYYLGESDLPRALERTVASLVPGGAVLAVHWRHPVAEYPRTGDEVHRHLAEQPGLSRLARHSEPDFLAEVFLRADGQARSVAQATGLV
jgi:trans-aconitate methyltransferase